MREPPRLRLTIDVQALRPGDRWTDAHGIEWELTTQVELLFYGHLTLAILRCVPEPARQQARYWPTGETVTVSRAW